MSITLGSYLLPILQTLATHGPDVVVPSSTVKTAVHTSVGLPDDTSKASAMVDNAVYELKLRACVTTHGRAGWALTPLGLEVAEGRKAMPTKGSAPAKETAVPVATATPPAAPVAVTPPVVPVTPISPAVVPTPPVTPAPVVLVGVDPEPTVTNTPALEDDREDISAIVARVTGAFAPPPRVTLPVVPASEWMSDPAVRATVTANTPCFGQWSAVDTACEGCALTDYCRGAQAEVLRLLADRLMVKTLQEQAKRLHTAVAASMGVTPRSAAMLSPGTKLIAPNDGRCGRSGKPYSAGQTVTYVPGLGNCLDEV